MSVQRNMAISLLLICLAVGSDHDWDGAVLPEGGYPVAEFEWLDDATRSFMEDHNISAGIIGIMRNGVVVYQRGFGWYDSGGIVPIPENALVRIASCTKPITAASIRSLVSRGLVSLDDFAFDLGQTDPGVLDLVPFPELGDTRLADVTIRQCLAHTGGWDRTLLGFDGTEDCRVAEDMGIESPPGVDNKIAWGLGQPLQNAPGDSVKYSNFGYCVLGKIIEEVSGLTALEYHRRYVLTPDMWVPRTDLRLGRTFAEDQPFREAWYNSSTGRTCVFPRDGLPPCDDENLVSSAYGAWHHEGFVGFGGVVLSAATMLEFAERYFMQNHASDIGVPLTSRRNGVHGGTLSGTNTLAGQRQDGVNYFVFFNKDGSGDDYHFATNFFDEILELGLDAQSEWPSLDVEGFWVDPGGSGSARFGSYQSPYADLGQALDSLSAGSRVIFKPGTSDWRGTIATKLQFRAPLGAARIGVLP